MGFRNKKNDWAVIEDEEKRYVYASPPLDIDQKLEGSGLSKTQRQMWFGNTNQYKTGADGEQIIVVPLNYRKDWLINNFMSQMNKAFGSWKIEVNPNLGQ